MEGITFVGLDAYKDWVSVAMMPPDRDVAVEWRIPNQATAIRRMLRRIEGEARGEVRFCYEAGPCGYALQPSDHELERSELHGGGAVVDPGKARRAR